MDKKPTKETPRWKYRFDNYRRAFSLLREAIELKQERELTQLEQEGIIQRFEYTWELAWKLLKDYLEYNGINLATITPSATIKAAFAAKIIANGEGWMQALDARNKMSHTYDFKVFSQIITDIEQNYLHLFDQLYMKLLDKLLEV